MKTVLQLLKIFAVVYILICILLYFIQEKLIFYPEKLADDHVFVFDQPFEEIRLKATDHTALSGVLFTTSNARGLIFYLHGNAGSVQSWGQVAGIYTAMQYDVFMPDYRGYGKSGGNITSEKQFYDDVQLAYDSLKKRYNEQNIIIAGYSIGTGAAAKLASANKPRLIILHAPYYSLTDMLHHRFRILPAFILKYKFETNKMLPACSMPVVIFHGDRDEVIYYGSSLRLQQLFKPADTLVTLHGQGHNGISDNQEYVTSLQKILQAPVQ